MQKTLRSFSMPCIYLPLLLLSVLIACKMPSESTEGQILPGDGDIAFTHVNILTMQEETVLSDQTLWVRDGSIYKIGKDIDIPEGVTIIDGSGKYLMPGLAEMHAHIPVPRDNDESLVEETFFLYLANGVTLIRGMLGNPYHIPLRERVETGEILGPRIFTSGPSINGNSAPSDTVAMRMVREQKEAGYDFLKLHPGLKLHVFDSIVATANEVGIRFAGHVSIYVGIRHAIESEYASIDHIDGYLEGLVPPSAGLAPDQNGFFGFNFVDEVDMDLLSELAEKTQSHQVAIVPTQCLMERWTSPRSPEDMASDPEMIYIPPRTLNQWKQGKFSMLRRQNYSEERFNKFIDIRRQIIRALKAKDVLFLLGSDSPQVFNVPGFSINREIQSMIDAGLTPYEVLKSGTANPATYFGDQGKYGTLVEGASADMIYLEANPLEDIENLKKKLGVMIRGKYISKNEIDTRLSEIATKYASMKED